MRDLRDGQAVRRTKVFALRLEGVPELTRSGKFETGLLAWWFAGRCGNEGMLAGRQARC